MSLPLSATGTLLSFSVGEETIIYPYSNVSPYRGGAFWCLPNFDEGIMPFTMRHGEYRKVTGNSIDETYSKKIEGPWGSLATTCHWNEDETGVSTTMQMTSLSHETLIRPGFHPYFVMRDDLLIRVAGRTFYKNSIPLSLKLVIPCNEGADFAVAEMQNIKGNYIIRCKAASSEQTRNFTYAYCLWTDDIEKYICIEPVIGISFGEDTLPSPFSLKKNEVLSINVQIIKQK